MLINKAATPSINVREKIYHYDAFVISEAGVKTLYIEYQRFNGLFGYFIIHEDGSYNIQFVDDNSTFKVFTTKPDYIHAIDKDSISFDKVTYRD